MLRSLVGSEMCIRDSRPRRCSPTSFKWKFLSLSKTFFISNFCQEIDELLSGGLTEEDEEDILNELAELEQLELPSVPDTQIAGGVDDQLPDVPTSEPGKFVFRIFTTAIT